MSFVATLVVIPILNAEFGASGLDVGLFFGFYVGIGALTAGLFWVIAIWRSPTRTTIKKTTFERRIR